MWLDIGVGGAEQLLCARDGEAFDHIDMLAAAVEAVAGIALERLVADFVAERLAHRAAHDVLRSDELDPGALAARLVVKRGAHFRIGINERPRSVDRGIAAAQDRRVERRDRPALCRVLPFQGIGTVHGPILPHYCSLGGRFPTRTSGAVICVQEPNHSCVTGRRRRPGRRRMAR